jgi:hypothetical protein
MSPIEKEAVRILQEELAKKPWESGIPSWVTSQAAGVVLTALEGAETALVASQERAERAEKAVLNLWDCLGDREEDLEDKTEELAKCLAEKRRQDYDEHYAIGGPAWQAANMKIRCDQCGSADCKPFGNGSQNGPAMLCDGCQQQYEATYHDAMQHEYGDQH